MNQLNQQQQPLTDTQTDTLLAVACADDDLLAPCFIGDLTVLVDRGYIIHSNKFPLACELTTAGRELIPALVQHQAL